MIIIVQTNDEKDKNEKEDVKYIHVSWMFIIGDVFWFVKRISLGGVIPLYRRLGVFYAMENAARCFNQVARHIAPWAKCDSTPSAPQGFLLQIATYRGPPTAMSTIRHDSPNALLPNSTLDTIPSIYLQVVRHSCFAQLILLSQYL